MLKTLLASVLVIAVSLTALAVQTEGFQVFTAEGKRRLTISRNPEPVVAVDWQNQRGDIIGWDTFHGQYLLVDFIYTRCETLCRALGAQFFQIQQQAADLIEAGQLQLLSVSFDGERDQPRQLQDYLNRFTRDTDSWVAVRTLNQQQQQQLLDQFGVIAIADGFGGYLHNAALHLVSPQGKLVQIVDYQDADQLISQLRDQLEVGFN